MLANLAELLQDAKKNNYAIASINTPNQISLRAVIAAAEEVNIPITINHAQNEDDHIPIEIAVPLMLDYAKKSTVPISVHVDHGLDMKHIMKAVRLGVTSVMYDCSNLPLEENIAEVKRLMDLVGHLGIAIEAEVGTMPNNMPDEVHGQERSDLSDLSVYYTDPKEAQIFCEQTGVDVLTISFGSVHGMYEGEPNLNIPLLEQIRDLTPNTSLGMHGGSGVPYDQIQKAISSGIRKINYFTAIDTAPAPHLAKLINEADGPVNFWKLADEAMEIIYEKTVEVLRVCKNEAARA
ncbi:MAG TPA: class II fructose-bisphosphate aldolase [Firmicutes bacterium]|jgi:fructose-bisphosphate aldolase class II|nr:class II fructose-bisphosphate aldolase [Bacillota bacterium]HHT43600.1 class II fructose-bisphosphate aldolase [Bacillota bacterium]